MTKNTTTRRPRRATGEVGFTLLEMLVALAMFLVISAAAFSLFSQHQPMFTQQQNLAGLNISLRNTVAQLELDIVNAGANYYQGINIPNWPVGVVINNNVVASNADCRTSTQVYGANCFDTLTVVTADPNTAAMNPSVNAVTAGGDTNCTTPTDTRTFAGTSVSGGIGTLYLIPPSTYTAAQITALAGNFHTGDQILYVTSSGAQYTTAVLSAAGTTQTVGGVTYIKLFPSATSQTTVSGTTYSGYNVPTNGTTGPGANDPIGMTTNVNTMLGEQYCATDWVLRLTPIQYYVDLTSPTNPALMRKENGTANTLAEEIIGFKVGASQFQNSLDTDTTTYSFDASTYLNNTAAYNYTVVRSVMISIVGRTPPQTDPTYTFRNTFDGGPYEIQGVSVVVNPRNMSMTDH